MAWFLLRDRSRFSATEFIDQDNTANSTLLHLAIPAPSICHVLIPRPFLRKSIARETILVIGSQRAGNIGVNRNAHIPNSCARLEQREFQSTGS